MANQDLMANVTQPAVQGRGKHLQSGELEEGALENTASNLAVWLESVGPLNDT